MIVPILTTYYLIYVGLTFGYKHFPNNLLIANLVQFTMFNIYFAFLGLPLAYFCSWDDIIVGFMIFLGYLLNNYFLINHYRRNPIYKNPTGISDVFRKYIAKRITFEYLNTLDDELIQSDNYILAVHPHGTWPMTAFNLLFDPIVRNNKKTFLAVHSILFYVPFIAELSYSSSFQECTEKSIRNILARNQNVMILPGGEQEIINHEPDTELIYAKRKGIFRISLETGKAIVPIVAYYENDVYYNWTHPILRSFLKKLINTPMMFTMGDFPKFWLPRKTTIKVCCGNPIDLKLIDGKTKEERIEAYRQVYIKALEDLHSKYCPDPARAFIIIK